jgi:signal peptide peptidase SppA
MRSGTIRTAEITRETLAQVAASDVLALDARALSVPVRLLSQAPELEFHSMQVATSAPKIRVAVVDMFGPVAQRAYVDGLCAFVDGYDSLEARLGAALEDEDVDAVVLRIDSPGGDAAGMAEAVRRMRSAVAASGKPVVAYVDELAASAAYAIACVASEIILPETGEVGSIGCLCVHFDASGAYAQAGIRPTIIRSGSQKAVPSSLEPLADDGRAVIQARVQAHAQAFAALVASSRGETADDWLALEGATARGKQAVKKGLADRVGSLEDAISSAMSRAEKNMTKQNQPAGLSAREEDAELAGLGRAVMAVTGAANTQDALASLGALRALAARAQELEAAEKARTEQAEARERVELVTKLVVGGALDAANAWALDEVGAPNKAKGVAADWASMPIVNLRAMASKIRTAPALGSSAPKPMADGPNDIDRARAARLGVSAEAYARGKSEITAAMSAQHPAGAGEGSAA